MNYGEMSDFDINFAVAKARGLKLVAGEFGKDWFVDDVKHPVPDNEDPQVYVVTYSEWHGKTFGKPFDPCNSWADAGPIIENSRIRILPILYSLWVAEDYLEDFSQQEENPCRAAMIVFLMMQEDK